MEANPQITSAREAALAGNIPHAIELLNKSPDIPAAVDTCIELVRDLYWKKKDITATLAIGKAGITLALREANRPAVNPTTAAALQKNARILSYNLSSFCWTGWNEPGITLGPEEIATGRNLSTQHLDLVTRHEPQPRILANAHWLVGAHLLTARNYPAALEHFQTSERFAKEARMDEEDLLAQGYMLLTRLLQHPNPLDRELLNAVKTRFKAMKEGDEYIQQLETAEAVFSSAS